MSSQLQLTAAVYPDEEHAQTIFDMLQKMHHANNIELMDSALVSRGPDGKLNVKDTHDANTGKGLRRGAIIGGVFGLIFPPSLIVSALVGGGIGAAWGKLRSTGIKAGPLKDVADGLKGSEVAIVTLADAQWSPKIERALEGYEGHLIRQSLSEEEASALHEAAATDS